jgi:hypothetical protein
MGVQCRRLEGITLERYAAGMPVVAVYLDGVLPVAPEEVDLVVEATPQRRLGSPDEVRSCRGIPGQ